MNNHNVYLRNNWSTLGAWTPIRHAGFYFNGSLEMRGTEAAFSVEPVKTRKDEVSTANVYRMYSECYVDEVSEHGTDTRFHGFITGYDPSPSGIKYTLNDLFGVMANTMMELGSWYADVIHMGTAAVPVELKLQVEDGEDRYIPDWAVWTQAYIGGAPSGPPYTNRRTWKAVGRLIDSGADPGDYPDKVIPSGLYTIGNDLLNYLQFSGYTPVGTITIDFLSVYEEGTNQIEDVILDAMTRALAVGGGELVAGVHYDATAIPTPPASDTNYYARTIFPSGITVNEWHWGVSDGSVAEMITSLLQNHAPPNYGVWWDMEKLMLRMQYREQTAHQTTTGNYAIGSYSYGNLVGYPPSGVTSDYIDKTQISANRQLPKDDETFRSRIVVEGINEYPLNLLDPAIWHFKVSGVSVSPAAGEIYTTDSLTNNETFESLRESLSGGAGTLTFRATGDIPTAHTSFTLTRQSGSGDATISASDGHSTIICLVYDASDPTSWPSSLWPTGWTTDGSIAGMVDFDVGTYHRIWYDHNNSPPDADHENYHPAYFVDLGQITDLGILRWWGLWSRRPFQFGARVEVHSDDTYFTYSASAPWEVLHKELYDKRFNPYEEVKYDGNFLRQSARYLLISGRPAKIHLRFRFAFGFTDIQLVENKTVRGEALIVESAPSSPWVHVSGGTPGANGEWYQYGGEGDADGKMAVIMQDLWRQLCYRGVTANKLVAGHQTDFKTNNSLSNTNMCALEAARILYETLRDRTMFTWHDQLDGRVQLYKTVKLYDPYWDVYRRVLVESMQVDGTEMTCVGTAYGYSDASRAGAWTSEVPNAVPA